MELRFYTTPSGSSPVEKYLLSVSSVERALVLETLDVIRERGLDSAQVVMRHIEGRLWELKISAHRVFYIAIKGHAVVLLHAYRKQSQKAPQRQLDVARKRMKEVLSYEET